MRWVVQSDMGRFDNARRAAEALAIHGEEVVPMSLSGKDVAIEAAAAGMSDGMDACIYGSTKLARYASGRWFPGSFDGAGMDVASSIAGWPGLMLNGGGKVMRLDELSFDGIRFVRPVRDGKTFAGEVVDSRRLSFWKEIRMTENRLLTGDSEVLVAPLRSISCETRCFVVDGEIVAASEYMRDGMLNLAAPDGAALAFAGRAVQAWTPQRAFTLDVCVADGEFAIVETNCINTSGLYAADEGRLFGALAVLVREMASERSTDAQALLGR